MTTHRFGFFASAPPGESLLRLKSLLSPASCPDKLKLLAYLKSGVELVAVAGPGTDYLDPNSKLIGSPNVLTDGTWVWTADVAYFLEKYNIVLPSEFVDHIKKNLWTVPPVAHPELIKF